MQLPPPIHGACIMNSYVQKSSLLNKTFNMDILSLNYVKSTTELRIFSFKKIFKFIRYYFSLFYKLIVNRPDLVYFTITPHGAAFYRDILMVVLVKIFGIKLVYHLHGKGIKRYYPNHKRIYNYVYNDVDVICLGNRLTDDIPFFKKVPYIVNNGIPVVNSIIYKQKKIKNKMVVRILYLSNFVESKGVIDLLESAKLLKNKGIPFKMQLIGQYRGNLTQDFFYNYIYNNSLLEQIEVVGPVYGNDKNPYFAHSDIFVHPTYNDAFPTVILEAMQFALPCISTFEGSIPEIIENNITGLLFEQRNIEDLSNKLELLIQNQDLREQMGQKGKERFYQFFTLEKFEKNLCNVFNKISKN
jgi:glycosyltransferase involved in cell wall biosynthesis